MMITTPKLASKDLKFSTLARAMIRGVKRCVVIESVSPSGIVVVSVVATVGREFFAVSANELHQF